MMCPVCLEEMDASKLFKIEIDICRFCGGLWLDCSELGQFVMEGKIPKKLYNTYAIDDSRKAIGEGSRNCPRCSDTLKVINHRGVNLDYCYGCGGIWFDRRELAVILKSYAKEVKKKNKPGLHGGMKRRLDDEGNEIFSIDDDFLEGIAAEEQPLLSKDDPLTSELLAAGSVESLVEALPKDILDEGIKTKSRMGGIAPPAVPLAPLQPRSTRHEYSNIVDAMFNDRRDNMAGVGIVALVDFVFKLFDNK